MTNREGLPTDGEVAAKDAPADAESTGGPEATPAPENENEAEPARGPENGAEPTGDPESTPWTGPSAWVFPGLVAAFGAVAVWGAFTIHAPPNSPPPGPGVFPGIVGGLLLLVAALMARVNLRVARRTRNDPDARPREEGADWPPVAIIVVTLAAHVALLETLGWLLAGAMLFWGVAYAFGARSPLRDAVVALSMSAAVQVGFSFGLGLNLPGGVVELVL